jgi:hypothetical protein
MSYDNTNTGMLAANERREKDTHPTHTGVINVDGREYWLSAWVNEGKEGGKLAGKKYFRLSVKPKEAPQNQARSPHAGTMEGNLQRHALTEDPSDDIPSRSSKTPQTIF